MTPSPTETIVAQATPAGRGGVGIVRVSGDLALSVAKRILKQVPQPRQANYLPFYNANNEIVDQGIALFFKAPNSFTGEDVLELQGHGGPVIMDMLIEAVLAEKGTRIARPGEFSEQAFLNDKLDLTQAEAIADLIDANSRQAARSAMQSLQGKFSKQVNGLSNSIIHLRMYVEAAIDFPEEEIDFLSDGKVQNDLQHIIDNLQTLLTTAQQGSLLREGLQVVIAGRPNAGKSSLLNRLAGKEAAIVTDIAGTTRDTLKEYISINGVPLHIIDTAGLRESDDTVEQIGIERAWQAIDQADHLLFMVDANTTAINQPFAAWPEFLQLLPKHIPMTIVRNKIDLVGEQVASNTISTEYGELTQVTLSAAEDLGIDILRSHLSNELGLHTATEGQFIARRRHIDALQSCLSHLTQGQQQLHDALAGELLAEDLRFAHQVLCEITGEFTSDDLLAKIFSSFCIGK